MDRRAESSDRSRGASMTRDVAIRESAPPISRSIDHSRQASQPSTAAERHSNDVWTSAISRLQAQVSYNTGMLESHRRQLTEIESVIARMHHEVSSTVAMLNDVRAEVRARPAPAEPPRHDTGDLEVLAGQLQRLTNRVNEIDGMSMQIDLMKNRMKRIEEGGAIPVQPQRPGPPPSRKGGPPYEATPHQPHPQQQPLPPHPPHSQHPPLPPMRTASMASADATRPPTFPAPPTLESQSSHGFRPSTEPRIYPGEGPPPASQPPPGPGLRPGEALPPPSALSGWRPAESYPSHGPHGDSPAVAPHPPPHGAHPPGVEADPHGGPGTGWAAVNANPAIKRPPEEARSPYESPLVDGSKRAKLAPLMPNMSRGGYPEEVREGYGQPQAAYRSQEGTSNPSEGSFQQRSRAPSDGSQPPSQPLGPTPAQQSLQHNFRFVTSSQQTEPPEPWRGEPERGPPPTGRGGRGRGRGGRGRGRGRGGRGGGGGGGEHHIHPAHHPLHGHPHHGPHEHPGGTPEWERPGWERSQASPNGNHHSAIMPSYSPRLAARGPPPLHAADAPSGSPIEHPHDYPATPTQSQLGSVHDPYGQGGPETSSGKKTRTKPIRNAEGILIRKDGRPDMRSVSSANNLRKVHAKKEQERMEMGEDEDGQTRSATPASAAAGEMDTSEEPTDAQERHHELMSRIFPHSGNEGPGAGRVAEQFFPRHHQHEREQPMKTESGRETREGSSNQGGGGDVVMGESHTSEERGREEDVKQGSQEHASGEDMKGAEQPAETAA